MIPLRGLFEGHLNVADLRSSMAFYGQALGLELAAQFDERRVAFYWIGGVGQAMLGLWEVGSSPQRQSLHLAFRVDCDDLSSAVSALRAAGIPPLDFFGQPTDEPVVLGWMPAAAVYFRDPDGHLLELLSMLPGPPRPDLGILNWSDFQRATQQTAAGG